MPEAIFDGQLHQVDAFGTMMANTLSVILLTSPGNVQTHTNSTG